MLPKAVYFTSAFIVTYWLKHNSWLGYLLFPPTPIPCQDTLFSRLHDDVIKWKHFPGYWPFVRGSHRSPVNSPHKGKWRGAVMFSLICAWINRLVNNRKAGVLICVRAHYDAIVMDLVCLRAAWNFIHRGFVLMQYICFTYQLSSWNNRPVASLLMPCFVA